jgi:hypothetical protein
VVNINGVKHCRLCEKKAIARGLCSKHYQRDKVARKKAGNIPEKQPDIPGAFGDQLVSSREFANVVGVDYAGIRTLCNDKVLPSQKAGEGATTRWVMPLGPAMRAYIRYKIAQVSTDGKDADLTSSRMRRFRALAEYDEIRVALVKGELHRSQDVTAVLMDDYGQVKSTLLNMPARVSRLVAGKSSSLAEIQEIIEKEIDIAVSALKPYDPNNFYSRNPEQSLLLSDELGDLEKDFKEPDENKEVGESSGG